MLPSPSNACEKMHKISIMFMENSHASYFLADSCKAATNTAKESILTTLKIYLILMFIS